MRASVIALMTARRRSALRCPRQRRLDRLGEGERARTSPAVRRALACASRIRRSSAGSVSPAARAASGCGKIALGGRGRPERHLGPGAETLQPELGLGRRALRRIGLGHRFGKSPVEEPYLLAHEVGACHLLGAAGDLAGALGEAAADVAAAAVELTKRELHQRPAARRNSSCRSSG